jgi:hypothetical protein
MMKQQLYGLAFGITCCALPISIAPSPAIAQACTHDGDAVTCGDGRRGLLSGKSIIWTDGTRSSAVTQHPSVIIGNKASVHVGQGVLVGQGSGAVQLDDPSKMRCAILDGVSYCE